MSGKDEKSFRELEQELSRVLSRVEQAEYEELDDLLADYKSGKKIIESLEKKLANAKNTIKRVK